MARTIREDVSESINPGQSLFDKDGSKVGYVDLADGASGWMTVGAGELEVKSYYVPYRLVTNADEREIFVSVTKEELRNDYSKRPPRTTVVNEDTGKPIATTTEPSGYDGRPVFVREVNLDKVKKHLASGQRVWSSDDADLGEMQSFDAMTGFMLVKKGVFAKRDLLLPISVVAHVDHDAGEVNLIISKDDLKRMQHLEPIDVVLPASGAGSRDRAGA